MSNSRSKKLANASGKESIMKASQRKTKDFESSQFSVNEAGSRTLAQSNIGGSHHMKMGHNLTVFDASGNDVTPLPLVSPLKTVRNEAGLGKDSVMDMLNNLDALVLTGSWSASVFERNNMSGVSGSSRASAGSVSDKTEDDDGASIESADSDDGIKFYLYIEGAQTKPSTGKQRDPNQVNQKHIEIDPNKQINLMLRETDTMCFLDIQSICISNDFTEEVQIIKSANAKYKELLSRQNNDNYSDKAMQTFNYPSKSKDIQANPLKFANAECMVNQWCIHDAYIERELIADVDGTENTYLLIILVLLVLILMSNLQLL